MAYASLTQELNVPLLINEDIRLGATLFFSEGDTKGFDHGSERR